MSAGKKQFISYSYSYKVPEYVINLDLPPVERWTQVATEKKSEVGSFHVKC